MNAQLDAPPRAADPSYDLVRRAMDALLRELGVADTARFFAELGLTGGDSLADQRARYATLTRDEVDANIRAYEGPHLNG